MESGGYNGFTLRIRDGWYIQLASQSLSIDDGSHFRVAERNKVAFSIASNGYMEMACNGYISDGGSGGITWPSLYAPDAKFCIGAGYGPDNETLFRYFTGLISECKIWSKVMTREELEKITQL